jgi:hypothetical protein
MNCSVPITTRILLCLNNSAGFVINPVWFAKDLLE